MNQDPRRRKDLLRDELLRSIDERNARLHRRRLIAPPVVTLAALVVIMMLIPSSLTTTGRVPIHVSWIPSVSMDQLLESDRIGLVDDFISVEPCLAMQATTMTSGPGVVHRLSGSEEIQRIDDEEVTELLARLAQQSS